MITTDLNFDNFAQEAQSYIDDLAKELGHPEEKKRVLKIWRSVMHTLRDRIHLGESFQLLAPLPMILKGIYVEGWKFSEKPPLTYTTLEEMKSNVKELQSLYGERDFPWKIPTEEIIAITLNSLKRYIPEAQIAHILNQTPKEVKDYLDIKVG